MKPPPFSYAAPDTAEECVALMGQYSDEAKVLAGGQSLMPLLSLRMVRPSVIVDIGRVAGLSEWKREGDVVHIGALVRQRVIEIDDALKKAVPILGHAVGFIGHPATRSRGTIVGSMCHADPAAELPVCAALLGGEFLLRSSNGKRSVRADAFFEDALSTAVRSDEIVESVTLPVAPHGAGFAFDEVARRHGDFALVSVAASVISGDAKVAVGGAGPRPKTFRYSDFATGKIERSRIAEFGQHVASLLEPNSDLHATSDYRRALAAILVERTLTAAYERADRS